MTPVEALREATTPGPWHPRRACWCALIARRGGGLHADLTRPAGAQRPAVVVPDAVLRDADRSRALLDLARTHSP